MRIALIYTKYFHKKFNENLAVVDDEFGKYTPLSLCYLASIIKSEGHEVIIVDAFAENLSKQEILERLKKFKPDVIGASFHSAYNVHDTLPIITYLKKELNKPVLAGGYNFNLYPEEHMVHDVIDYGLLGDNIDSLPMFFKAFPKKIKLNNIPGLCYRDKGRVKINPLDPAPHKIRFRKLPLPARHLLKSDKYHQFISKRKNFAIMLTHTGCPYPCTFCTIPNYKFDMRSPEHVVEEIEDCYYNHGIREIDFFDAVFTIDKKRTEKICDMLMERKLDLQWSCRSRIDTVSKKLLKKMSKAGCVRIYYGIESIDPVVLKNIRKGVNMNNVVDVINTTKKYDIMPLGFFMIGNPGDTVESVKATADFAKQLKLDYAQFSMTIAKPKTNLDQELIKSTGEDFWREYIKGNVKEKRLSNVRCDLSNKEIYELTKWSYRQFYFRPNILIKHITKIKSLHEFKRYIVASLKVINEKYGVDHWSKTIEH